MGEEWHYTHQGEEHGPVSSSELKQLAAAGGLLPSDLVWKDGLSDWVPATKLKGVSFSAPRPTPPRRPPAPKPPVRPPAMRSNTTRYDGGQDKNTWVKGIHNQRFAISVAAGAGMLSTFLPWVHAPIIGSVSGTAGDGWITLVLFVPAMVLALLGEKSQILDGGQRLGAVIPAGVAGLIGLIKIVNFYSTMSNAARDNPFAKAFSGTVQIGIGIYLLIAAGAAVGILAWVLAKPSHR